MSVHDYLFARRDLRDWHHDFDGIRAGDKKPHGGAFTDSPAFTHCICYGAAARTAEPLLAEIERLREALTRIAGNNVDEWRDGWADSHGGERAMSACAQTALEHMKEAS